MDQDCYTTSEGCLSCSSLSAAQGFGNSLGMPAAPFLHIQNYSGPIAVLPDTIDNEPQRGRKRLDVGGVEVRCSLPLKSLARLDPGP